MVEVSKQFIEDLIDSLEFLIEKEGLPEGSGLPSILKEAKELINNKGDNHG